MNSQFIFSSFARVLVHCLGAQRVRDFNWGDSLLELVLQPHWYAGCPSTQHMIPAGGVLSVVCPPDCGDYRVIFAEIDLRGLSVILNCYRIDFPYTPSDEIFIFHRSIGTTLYLHVYQGLTGDATVLDAA